MSRRYTRILCGVEVMGMYQGHPWFPGILSIKGLRGRGEEDTLHGNILSIPARIRSIKQLRGIGVRRTLWTSPGILGCYVLRD